MTVLFVILDLAVNGIHCRGIQTGRGGLEKDEIYTEHKLPAERL